MKAWCAPLIAVAILLTGCAASGQTQATDTVADDGGSALSSLAAASRMQVGALDSFFNQVNALHGGAAQQIRIIQLGDSHTAADFFTGQLRETLQAQLGNAGIGTRAAGIPYAGIRRKDMTLAQDGRWQYHNSLTDHGFTDYGLSGFTAVSRAPGAALSLTATDPKGFDRGFVDFVHRPSGGVLQIYLDDKLAESVQITGPAGTLGRVSVNAPGGHAHSLKLVAGDRGIEILAWNTERDDPGVILDSFGVVGATAGIIDNWSEPLVRQELALMRPALIILAYGTNEGVRTNFDGPTYQTEFGDILGKLRRWSAGSSLLVIGPTDGEKQNHACAKSTVYCAWQTLPAVDEVRRLQYVEAQRHRAAFWNSAEPEQRSGGIKVWATMAPPLARPDHIHFTPTGYAILSNELYYWLNYWYSIYAHAHRLGETAL